MKIFLATDFPISFDANVIILYRVNNKKTLCKYKIKRNVIVPFLRLYIWEKHTREWEKKKTITKGK